MLFQELAEPGSGSWNYAQIRQPGPLHRGGVPEGRPLAAAWTRARSRDRTDPAWPCCCENSLGSACCDLACLTNDIFVTPLNIHFSADNLVWIFDRLRITVAVCDHPDRLETLLAVRAKAEPALRDLHPEPLPARRANRTSTCWTNGGPCWTPARSTASWRPGPRRTMREPATVMFTSGSTGRPKGVAFNQYNLVTKRFARAAALPEVGRDEVMLCYLPLFHTFGRYLEMLGTIFWGGTYVFAGNPSADTLLAQFQQVRPTALISVPVRWVQIRDRVMELAQGEDIERPQAEIFRDVVGDRLAWGLSAAGYLDPKVFRFFHRNGVRLCSGFGMTEGTGGLTMTPPDDYVEDSVGIPLPGVEGALRATKASCRSPAATSPAICPRRHRPAAWRWRTRTSDDFWLATGDLFRDTDGRPPGNRRPDQGHLQEQPRPDHRPAHGGIAVRTGARASSGPSWPATAAATTPC